MLKVFGGGARDCDGVTRRSFLQAGMLGLGGLALPDLLRIRARAARERRQRGQERHPVLAQRRPWPHGDLGPQARRTGRIPRPVRRDRNQRPRDPFGELLPEQARRMDRLAISGRSTTARATTPRATTGCSRATRDRPSTPPTTRSSAGRRSARRWPGSRRRATGAAPVRRRAEPPRRDRQPVPLRGLSRRLCQPVHRRVGPERPEVPGQEPEAAGRRHPRPPGGPPPRS